MVDGVHVVHAHGSIYRYLLLNSPDEIEKYAVRNQKNLEQYFRKHAVLIVGYSGWDDAITRALAGVERFEHNLYWTDRAGDPEKSNLSAAAKDILRRHRNAFYVPIAGADALMVQLHQRLIDHSLPLVFREPILVARDQLDLCDLSGVKLPRDTSRSDPSRTLATDGGATDDQDLGKDVQTLRKRLEDAQDLFTGKTSTDPAAVLAAEVRRRFASASDHYFSDRYGEALRELDFVVRNSEYLDPAERALALIRRGVACWQRGGEGDTGLAIADFTAVIDMPDVPAEQRAKALFNRGYAHGERGETDREIADYTAVIDTPDAPADQRATARNNRGVTYEERGEADRAVADYTAVIDDPDAPVEQKAKATRWRDQLIAKQQPPAPKPASPRTRRPSTKGSSDSTTASRPKSGGPSKRTRPKKGSGGSKAGPGTADPP
ncbi:hypothetical protein J0H58_38060 [bacterium]|nr:hypothetical protein [bacterium]